MVQVLVRWILTYRGVRDRALRPALMVNTPPHGRTGLQKERSSSLLLMEARISSNSVLDLVRHVGVTWQRIAQGRIVYVHFGFHSLPTRTSIN